MSYYLLSRSRFHGSLLGSHQRASVKTLLKTFKTMLESLQRFRKFGGCEDAAGPRDVLRHLRDLSGQCLRPDIHIKKQIVGMLVQEQFPAVLPEELRAEAQRCQPEIRITG